jgi:predicted O-linked N-acetylglucosamine transferase (SPINDLY family)
MNPSLLSPESLEAEALTCAQRGDYGTAAALYEQSIALNPGGRSAYWQLGLMRLLQGEEAEAQLTWMMILSEVESDPQQLALAQAELWQAMQTAAAEQTAIENLEQAWLIRHHLREINPSDLSNLLEIIQLSIQLKRFNPTDLEDLGICQILQTRPAVDSGLLSLVIQQVLTAAVESPQVLTWLETCLPYYTQNSEKLIGVVLQAVEKLSILLSNKVVAVQYLELCLQLDQNHSEILLHLGSLYPDTDRYAEGIEIAKRYYQTCTKLIDQVMGNALILRAYMASGTHWQIAEQHLQKQTNLLRQWMPEAQQLQDHQLLNPAFLTASLFFYPYFNDAPQANRPLQNQVAHHYQAALQLHLQTYKLDYKSYPEKPLVRAQDQKKIKIGYLSRSLRRHSVGWLCRWLFEYYDRNRFETHVYFNQQMRIDSFAKRWFADNATSASLFDGDILGIAKTIQEDGIDILVDLDSLTANHNCGVMALKPAPVQVTWLGLDASGIPGVDYFLADRYVLPDRAQDYYSEKIWRLPHSYIAVDGFEVGVPTLKREHLNLPADAVLYFSCQRGYKRHPETIRLKMKILQAVPNSYLLVKGVGDQEGIRDVFEQIAQEEGVSCDRLRFLGFEPDEETHRANLGIADVVLDTFPYNGATTTMETLWMGIPLVTKVGEQFAARNSYTMMMNAGINEGIAWNNAEYVAWGIRFGKNAELRQQISWKLRQSRQTSPLWKAKQFVRDLECAYEQMWQIFREGL